jgi:hypothetical protein
METRIFTCRRQLIAFCILSLSCNILLADTGTKIACQMIKSKQTGKSSMTNQLKSFLDPPFIYYFTEEEWNDSDRVLKIFSWHTQSEKSDSIILNIPSNIIINHLPDIAINDEYMILTDDEYSDLYRFKKIKNTYRFVNKLTLPPRSNGKNVSVLKENLFLLECIYNFHPDSETHTVNIGIYDAAKDKIINFIHPPLPCIAFSHLPNKWIAFNNERIALAYPCSYKIVFYDLKLNKTDSIEFNPGNSWRDIPGNKIPVETDPSKINPKILIDHLQKMQDTVTRIERIFFLDNQTLLVSSYGSQPNNTSRRIDVWKTDKLKSPVFSGYAMGINFAGEDSIIINALPPPLQSTACIIKNNTIYSIQKDDFLPATNMTINEFTQQKDLYYENNDPQFLIQLHKFSGPGTAHFTPE